MSNDTDNLVLTSEALRVVNKNDKGVVTYRKRYKRGDVVDVERMDADRVTALQASGALVPESEYLAPEVAPYDDFPAWAGKSRPENWDEFTDEEKRDYVYGQPDAPDQKSSPDAESTPSNLESPLEPTGPQDPPPGSGEPSGEKQVGEPIPDLENMGYNDLRSLASAKGLDVTGNTEALVNRLTEYYTS